MIYLPNYAGALRCIGQALESRNIDIFELIADREEFVIECADPNPPYIGSVKLHYSLDLITILDREGQTKRRQAKSDFRFDSLPEMLRATGRYVDSKHASRSRPFPEPNTITSHEHGTRLSFIRYPSSFCSQSTLTLSTITDSFCSESRRLTPYRSLLT